VGKFNSEDITSFIEELLRGKQETLDMKKISYVDRDCSEIEKVQETSEDDEILNEILQKAEEKPSFQKKAETRRGRKRKGKKDEL
jgi:hypothetical protein